jgi:cellulose synthase/poly-beta-1,6-N-acetylglucosamine synthase-like glycosyltransferase
LTAEHVRIAGVAVALIFAAYGVIRYRGGGWRRLDLLLAIFLAGGIGAIAVFPQIGDVFTLLFRLENRAFALLVASNLALFAFFLYLLNQIRANSIRNGRLVSALAIRQYKERFPERTRDDGGESDGRLLIVVPAYNEAPSIRDVLGTLPENVLGHKVDVLVVDDGSTDGIEEILLREDYPVAVHAVNRGQGDALRTGFEIARLEGADIVVNFDADGQYRADDLEDLIKPIVADEADYVHGSRFLGFYEESGSVRHMGVVFFSRLITVLSRQRITDATNGFRAIRGSKLDKLDLREESFSATELILEAFRNKLRLKEVPVSMLKRAEGESKKPKRLRYPFGVLRVIIQTWLR